MLQRRKTTEREGEGIGLLISCLCKYPRILLRACSHCQSRVLQWYFCFHWDWERETEGQWHILYSSRLTESGTESKLERETGPGSWMKWDFELDQMDEVREWVMLHITKYQNLLHFGPFFVCVCLLWNTDMAFSLLKPRHWINNHVNKKP